MTRTRLYQSERLILGAIFILVFFFIAFDLWIDAGKGVGFLHLTLEIIIAISAAASFILIVRNGFQKSHEIAASRNLISESRKEAERWKKESRKFIDGLSNAIDHQFQRWGLSPAEQDIARFLLKGLSLKEIAAIRETNEKTVRAQTTSIYSKSGLTGRADLAAFFLEDLLVPQTTIPLRK